MLARARILVFSIMRDRVYSQLDQQVGLTRRCVHAAEMIRTRGEESVVRQGKSSDSNEGVADWRHDDVMLKAAVTFPSPIASVLRLTLTLLEPSIYSSTR